MKNILLVGLNPRIIRQLEKSDQDIKIYIIEEEEIYENKFSSFHSKIIQKVFFGEYQQSEKSLDLIKGINNIKFSAVIAGREYAVNITNKIAKYLNLPRLGDLAAKCFINKYELRKECKKINIPQPNFEKVDTLDDVKCEDNIKFPKILKPSNRQSSVGVILLNDKNSSDSSWENTTNAKEEGGLVNNRDFNWYYQTEEVLDGKEVSTEVLVKNNKIIFKNITQKETTPSNHFVELGHIVPDCSLSSDTKNKIYDLTKRLVEGLEVQNGVLHIEWMITTNGPYLIECAGRAPGDNVTELISYSYDFNFFKELTYILMGEKTDLIEDKPKYISGIRYFQPKPGIFKNASGLENLEKDDLILKYELNIKKGEEVKKLESSWDRIGYYMFKVNNEDELQNLLNKYEDNINFEIE